MNHRIDIRLTNCLEQIDLGDDVVRQRGSRRGPARRDEALRCQVKDSVGFDRANHATHRAAILQLAIDDGYLARSHETLQAGLVGDALAFVQDVELAAIAQLLEIVQFAAPAEGPEDLHVRVVLHQVFGQEAPDHASNAGDQDAHRLSFETRLRQ